MSSDISLRVFSKQRLTLRNLLSLPLGKLPMPRDSKIASSTTNASAKKSKSPGHIIAVVYCPDLYTSSVEEATELAEQVVLDSSKDEHGKITAAIHPKYSLAYNSPEINSEQDTREWVHNGLVRPALAALDAIHGFSGSNDLVLKDLGSQDPLYVASGFSALSAEKRGPVSDAYLGKGPWKHGANAICLLTIEYKTSNALTKETFDPFFEIYVTNKIRENSAVPFVWPYSDDITIETKDTRVVCQIIYQMRRYKVSFAWLSSLNLNYFFYLSENQKELFMSNSVETHLLNPLFIFAWFCRASGKLKSKLNIPRVEYGYFDQTVDSYGGNFPHGLLLGSKESVEIEQPTEPPSTPLKRDFFEATEEDEEAAETTPKARPKRAKSS